MSTVLVVTSANFVRSDIAGGGPRKDYLALTERLEATLLDRSVVERNLATRLVARVIGAASVQAWLAFRRRHAYSAVFTDGERLGIPLALLLKIARDRRTHVTLGHRLSAPKKRPFFRWLRVHTHMSRILVHSSFQYELAVRELGIPSRRLALVPYQVDTEFWQPLDVPEERLVSAIGLERRDYATLFRAVASLDCRVAIGAASHWSRDRDRALDAAIPSNIEVKSYDYFALRDLYSRSSIVVVPLHDVDYQAGVTTILEAMAMAKPIIVTHSIGQTDLVEDRRAVTRGARPRPRPISLLRDLAAENGVRLEPNGFYVPPGDADALQRAIAYLLDHADERRELGAAGRRATERLLTVNAFAERVASFLQVDAGSATERTARKRHASGAAT